jgi:hypothetical protein
VPAGTCSLSIVFRGNTDTKFIIKVGKNKYKKDAKLDKDGVSGMGLGRAVPKPFLGQNLMLKIPYRFKKNGRRYSRTACG